MSTSVKGSAAPRRRNLVTAFPRLHFGLIDLGNVTPRKYGGSGVYLDGIPTRVVAYTGDNLLRGLDDLDDRERSDLEGIAQRARALVGVDAVTLEVLSHPPIHVGLGAMTALSLAVARAVAAVGGQDIPRESLIELSRRGGTSAIGVNAFFSGGFLFDAGRRRTEGDQGHRPSSANTAGEVSCLVGRLHWPEDWVIDLLLSDGKRVSGADEVAFFASAPLVSERDVLTTLAASYHGLAPAIATRDLDLFAAALKQINARGFKKLEIANQGATVEEMLTELWDLDLAAGMSSMGPLVFVVRPADDGENRRLIESVGAEHGATYLGAFGGRNTGATCEERRVS